jgi:uncharacterized protein YndB with AHSA1/START domain
MTTQKLIEGWVRRRLSAPAERVFVAGLDPERARSWMRCEFGSAGGRRVRSGKASRARPERPAAASVRARGTRFQSDPGRSWWSGYLEK